MASVHWHPHICLKETLKLPWGCCCVILWHRPNSWSCHSACKIIYTIKWETMEKNVYGWKTHSVCGRPGWHSKSPANFRPWSRRLRTLDPRSVAPETPFCEHLRYTCIGDGRHRRAVPFRPSHAGATRTPSNNRSTLRRELIVETVWKSPSALDHFYGKTGTLSVLVLAAPVWTTKCRYIYIYIYCLSVCLLIIICISNNRSRRPTTLVSEAGSNQHK